MEREKDDRVAKGEAVGDCGFVWLCSCGWMNLGGCVSGWMDGSGVMICDLALENLKHFLSLILFALKCDDLNKSLNVRTVLA